MCSVGGVRAWGKAEARNFSVFEGIKKHRLSGDGYGLEWSRKITVGVYCLFCVSSGHW